MSWRHALEQHHVPVHDREHLEDGSGRFAGEPGAGCFTVFGGIDPYALDRHGFFNNPEHGQDLRRQPLRVVQHCAYCWVVGVDPVTHPARKFLGLPHLAHLFSTFGPWNVTAGREGPPCTCTCFVRKLRQPLTNFDRGPGGRLANVNLPGCVGRIGYIQADARKPVRFVLSPSTPLPEAEPAAGHQQALVAVDVESLLCSPAFRAARGLFFFLGQTVLVRQHVALYLYALHRRKRGRRRMPGLGWMSRHEWVPRGDRLGRDTNTQLWPGPLEVTVEYHRKMVLYLADQIKEILVSIAIRDNTVQNLPDHERTLRPAGAEVSHELGCAVVRAFEQLPVILLACGKHVEIPSQTLQAIRPRACHRQPATLRKGRGFQTQAEAP